MNLFLVSEYVICQRAVAFEKFPCYFRNCPRTPILFSPVLVATSAIYAQVSKILHTENNRKRDSPNFQQKNLYLDSLSIIIKIEVSQSRSRSILHDGVIARWKPKFNVIHQLFPNSNDITVITTIIIHSQNDDLRRVETYPQNGTLVFHMQIVILLFCNPRGKFIWFC